MRVQTESNDPGPGADAFDPFPILGKAGQTLLKLAEHSGHVGKHPVGKFFLAQFLPEVFLWIEFRRIGREAVQPDILGHHQGFGHVRTGPIDDHEHELLGVHRADLGEELPHALRVHLRAEHPVMLAFERTDRPIHIGELARVTIVHHRARRGRRPAATDAHHAPKTRFVLKHQPHPAAPDLLRLQEGRQRFGEFFFQSCCACGSPLGCRVSGATLRQP